MQPITVSIELAAPIGAVWDALADVSSHSEWMADAQSIEFIGDRRSGVGTRIRVRTSVGPLRSDDIMEFDGWDPPRLMTVRHVGAVRGSGEFRLSGVGDDRTRLEWLEQLEFPWYLGARAGYVFARPILRRLFAANLRRFAASMDAAR
jgi:carbon monoxide dehydrogenase subunit G